MVSCSLAQPCCCHRAVLGDHAFWIADHEGTCMADLVKGALQAGQAARSYGTAQAWGSAQESAPVCCGRQLWGAPAPAAGSLWHQGCRAAGQPSPQLPPPCCPGMPSVPVLWCLFFIVLSMFDALFPPLALSRRCLLASAACCVGRYHIALDHVHQLASVLFG